MYSTALGLFALLISASTWATASTRHLGVAGQTYPVVEPDLLAEFRRSALKLEESREKMLTRINNYQPANLHSLPPAAADRTFLVDMQYTLDRDLTDASGKVIYSKGYSFNPLDYIVLSGSLIVIDGSVPAQVNWFLHSEYSQNRRVKLLLAGGKAADLIEKLQRPVFYLTDDIAERLHISATPALITRKGDKMQVQEFYVSSTEWGSADDKN